MMLSRNSGYFDLSQVQTAVLESNGRISFLPKSANRPLAPSDIGVTPEQELIFASVIFDGEILYNNLQFVGKDERWLKKALGALNAPSVENIFLATCDMTGRLNFYPSVKNKGELIE